MTERPKDDDALPDYLDEFYASPEYGWTESAYETRQRVREFCIGGQMAELTLYVCDDDPRNVLDWEERTGLAIWAESEDEARRIFLNELPKLTEYEEDFLSALIPRCKLAAWQGDGFEPEKATAHIEGRPEALRSLGWMFEDEYRCEVCDLAAYGIRSHSVCRYCHMCMGCRKAVGASEACENCDPPEESTNV